MQKAMGKKPKVEEAGLILLSVPIIMASGFLSNLKAMGFIITSPEVWSDSGKIPKTRPPTKPTKRRLPLQRKMFMQGNYLP
jgi:hypothetical protein